MSFPHQDWNTVILKNPNAKKPESTGNKSKKENGSQTKAMKKLESDEIVKPPKVGIDLKIKLQQARLSKKMSQKQLAQLVGVSQQDIANYENGKAVPNNQFVVRLEKVLGCRLPRIIKEK